MFKPELDKNHQKMEFVSRLQLMDSLNILMLSKTIHYDSSMSKRHRMEIFSSLLTI